MTMKRFLNAQTMIGLALAALVLLLTVSVLGSASKKMIVYTAKSDIAARKQIDAASLEMTSMNPADVPVGSLLNSALIIGHYTLGPVFTGQTFVTGNVTSTENGSADVLTQGMTGDERAFSISAQVGQALAGRLTPGDQVDVVAVLTGGGGSSNAEAITLISNATVLDINLSASQIEAAGSTSSSTKATNPATSSSPPVTVPGIYTLALTATQVETLALAESNGTLYLSLDPQAGSTPASGGPVTLNQLGTGSTSPGPTVSVPSIIANPAGG